MSDSDLPFADLGPDFADPVTAAEFPKAILRYRNDRAARTIAIEELSDADWIRHFARFEPLPGNMQGPLAIRYHGHQFGTYNPDLGDGRGFLFAQIRAEDGRLLDLGTKGSGRTPWSRSGDGRLTLKGGVREILASEMLEALGVRTSKTLSLIETGEALQRGDEPSPTRSSVMVRLCHSHIRFGAFQRLAYLDEQANLETLIRHSAEVYHPDTLRGSVAETAAALFERIVERTAQMVAGWMAAGFVHGVMNTDNMNVTGETFDFGPWRFLPKSDPNFVAAYFDQTGLYRFGRQPTAALWNLQQLGGAFAMVADPEALTEGLKAFTPAYQLALRDANFALLGCRTGDLGDDLELLQTLFAWMTETGASWPQTWFDLFCWPERGVPEASPQAALYRGEGFATLDAALKACTAERPERLAHAYFRRDTPETLMIEDVEALWEPVAESDDWSAFVAKLNGLASMREAYDWQDQPS